MATFVAVDVSRAAANGTQASAANGASLNGHDPLRLADCFLAQRYLIRYHHPQIQSLERLHGEANRGGMTRDRNYVDAAAHALRSARQRAGLSLRALADRAGTSHAAISAYEQGRKQPSAAVFLRILEACGNAVEIHQEPRIREADGIPRGEELAAVLRLAAQFPARTERHLPLPSFPHG